MDKEKDLVQNFQPNKADSSTPQVDVKRKQVPKVKNLKSDIPNFGHTQNVITVCGQSIEIFPTQLIYHRDKTALFYRAIQLYQLSDVITAQKGVFDKQRNGDKCLFDWLVAVFDQDYQNEKSRGKEFVKKYYNKMTSETINKALEIFKRLNGITQKEEAAKNRRAKETKA